MASMKHKPRQTDLYVLLFLFLILALGYIMLSLSDVNRSVATGSARRATFYLPDWLILSTVILPYLYVWLIGLLSIYRLNFYRHFVKGTLYKQGLGFLAAGIGIVVLTYILIQYLASLSEILNSLSLSALVQLIYLLLVLMASGYVCIAIGAKRLRKIEEV